MAINVSWHSAHRMPKNPTAQQRLEWHLAHAQACGCRKLTADMVHRLEKAVKASSG